MVRQFGMLCLAAFTLASCAALQSPRHEWLTPDSFVNSQELDARLEYLESVCREQQQHQAQSLRDLRDYIHMVHRENIESEESAAGDSGGKDRPGQCVDLAESINSKSVLGRSEWVGLPSLGTYMKARLDTGAGLSSISAEEITPFERDGEDWVRFKLALEDEDSVVPGIRDKTFELPLQRHVRIIQASATDRRPVVKLPLLMGDAEQTVEFTLNDRSHLSFPVLLGRDFMRDIFVVDVSESYTRPRPEFPGGESSAEAVDDQQDDEDVLEE